MEKTKLLLLLNSLSAWELRNLEEFLRSPFHNKRDDVLRLFEFYRAQRDKRNPNFSDAATIRAVWPGKPAKTADFPNLRSYLFKLTEKYLAVEEVFADEFTLKMHLGRAYERLGIGSAFEQTMREARSVLNKKPLRNPQYLRRQFELEYEILDHDISRGRIEENTLSKVVQLLDAHYLAEKLKLACAQISFLNYSPEKFDLEELRAKMNFFLEEIQRSSDPAIEVYYHAFLALSEEQYNPKHFEKVRQLLSDSRDQFTERELGDICRICINYCIKEFNKGNKDYANEGLDLYRSGIEKGYLFVNGRLPRDTYINTAAFGIRLNEYDWVDGFIGDYRYKLAGELRDRENAFAFSLGRLRYEQGNYEEAMPLLASFVTDNPNHFLIAKKMLCKIFYELKEIASLESLLDSMRAYLKRHKMERDLKKHFNLFINLMSQLVNLAPGDKKKAASIRKRLSELKIQADIDWFEEQLK